MYAKYAPYQFLAYWHELWRDYESLVGPFAEVHPDCYALLTGIVSLLHLHVQKQHSFSGVYLTGVKLEKVHSLL